MPLLRSVLCRGRDNKDDSVFDVGDSPIEWVSSIHAMLGHCHDSSLSHGAMLLAAGRWEKSAGQRGCVQVGLTRRETGVSLEQSVRSNTVLERSYSFL